ncbi:multidrug ABC transporter permease [Brevibacillus panacihumi W25]|uniref:Multidrug ABC transporter permease n=1 Tax=Brevibacillus panacihumi W25 TaxID=1408254 RepID=V6M0Z2_9BACL|nr:hypothetical protein [Brevibacillus panacihumi]EST51570.1 multidrug ABC transporter permease [Brevibacillus panacihumi W25]
MKGWKTFIIAEFKKEHRNMFQSNLIYFSLLFWPILKFLIAFYSFKPFFTGKNSPIERFMDSGSLTLFLLTGYLCYTFFWCLVQSAWRMSYERQSGTLEMIFITPVNRLAFIYGRSLSSLIEGIWLYFTFIVIVMFLVEGIQINGWLSIPLAFIILLVSAVVWGGFLTIAFLFSRDASM